MEEGEEEDEGKADCAATVLYSLYEAPMLWRLWLQSAAAQRPAREKPFHREAVKAARLAVRRDSGPASAPSDHAERDPTS